MKIICVEEHITDVDILRASQGVLSQIAGYMKSWNAHVQDRPELFNDNRPHLNPHTTALALAADAGEGRIAEMDRHGIDMQILAYSNAPQLAPINEANRLTRAANDRLAQIVRANPTRFSGFATLPWQNPQAAADELDRAVNELGLVGTLLVGRPGEAFLDDPQYMPVLEKLNELRMPIYVHPFFPLPQVRQPYYDGLGDEVSARLSVFGWGWHNEAGIHVVRMMLAGLFEKFPDLQVISGHWGEMVPFFLQRMDDMIPMEATGLSRTITDTYKSHVTVTPSGMLNLPHFKFTHEVLGADRIIYSVDYPYLTNTGARDFLEALPVGADDKERIAHGNAERLFSRS